MPGRRRGGSEMSQYLLGMGPMPPPRPQDIAVASFYRNVDGPTQPAADASSSDDESEVLEIPGPVAATEQAQAQVDGGQCKSLSHALFSRLSDL